MSSREASSFVRALLEMAGTDLDTNDHDPYGNGDQSVVKVNSSGIDQPLFLHDESRSCFFRLDPGSDVHALLVDVANQQTAVLWKTVHIEARFDANTDCYVYPHTAYLKKWCLRRTCCLPEEMVTGNNALHFAIEKMGPISESVSIQDNARLRVVNSLLGNEGPRSSML